jgi:ABC-type uncharacterized transport system YnjBCD ATPase subunit
MKNQIMTTQLLRQSLERKKGQLQQLQQSLMQTSQYIQNSKSSLAMHEQAREVIRTVGMDTQNQLSYNISDITSLALDSVFPDPYTLTCSFVQRRNKTECDLTFVRDGNEIDPLTASGVGAVDVASFALRIASWSMARPRTRNVIILDEPFRFLSENYQDQASAMVKEISKKLGIQFIIVTHNETLTSYADKVFKVTKQNNKSKAEVI